MRAALAVTAATLAFLPVAAAEPDCSHPVTLAKAGLHLVSRGMVEPAHVLPGKSRAFFALTGEALLTEGPGLLQVKPGFAYVGFDPAGSPCRGRIAAPLYEGMAVYYTLEPAPPDSCSSLLFIAPGEKALKAVVPGEAPKALPGDPPARVVDAVWDYLDAHRGDADLADLFVAIDGVPRSRSELVAALSIGVSTLDLDRDGARDFLVSASLNGLPSERTFFAILLGRSKKLALLEPHLSLQQVVAIRGEPHLWMAYYNPQVGTYPCFLLRAHGGRVLCEASAGN